ncbi:hypothetical protein DSLASN_42340 [Desulfoluna limicola]|uniref:Uncharacterized protein n=1 Tax=Desulfoluna limicola TaxID=2810562 RepID=A0ABM7PM57_9BACT|nr:hypothetical protein DSLASN_42340 [Desulfoluna limicola]
MVYLTPPPVSSDVAVKRVRQAAQAPLENIQETVYVSLSDFAALTVGISPEKAAYMLAFRYQQLPHL